MPPLASFQLRLADALVCVAIYWTIVLSPLLGWGFLNRRTLRKSQITLQSLLWLLLAVGASSLFWTKTSIDPIIEWATH